MASRGWDGVTASDVAKMGRSGKSGPPAAKPSKYRNVRVVVDGEKFDSKREAAYWQQLKYREKAGDLTRLERQSPWDLSTDLFNQPGQRAVVCRYISDFCYFDRDEHLHVVDAKGKRTAIYELKKKWMELEHGIVIEEV